MARVVLEGLTKRYGGGGTLAVDSMDLEINDGEFVCLVGPSGCGKTTALRMIAGLEDITGGRVLIGDRVVNDLPPRDRDIALVFQSYALYPHMNVYENMAFSLRLRKAPKAKIDSQVHEAARILGLEGLLDRRPGQLSGGQRQRVALGRAIVREPAVFLMDEPLSNLDAKLRVQTRAEIARLHQRLKATMIYVTHDQVEAMTMADRIAVISNGVLQQVGTPRELYDEPRNRFVAGFIGSPSMNFSEVQVQDGQRLVGEGLTLSINASQAETLRRANLKSVVVGFRPEHLMVGDGDGAGLHVSAHVDVIEFLGSEELLHAVAGDQDLVALVSADARVSESADIVLSAPSRHIHLFDPESGLNLAASPPDQASGPQGKDSSAPASTRPVATDAGEGQD